jgi:predicted ribosomally synthesized peptide with nif11-like leader
MAKDNVAKFFAEVYENKSLQGALHGALAATSPETLVEIAKSKGFEFSQSELKEVLKPAAGELSDDEMQAVAGGAAFSAATLASSSLKTNFWRAVSPSRLGIGGGMAAFGLGIPGPSFVHVMSDETREDSEPREADEELVSATELYKSLA